jgi:hypothetical protein
MKRLVCYSLLLQNLKRRPTLLAQIVASLKSLRAHNKSVPVHVFVYGDEPDLPQILAPHDVTIRNQGSYEDRLVRSLHHGSQVLCRYPLLHKLLNFAEIEALAPEQVLLLDCDTFFSSDVDSLFERYSKADYYAREEPSCKRSMIGYDPYYLDEDLLDELASSEGITAPPPFNIGVVLLNNQLWRRMPPDSLLLSYTWRFAVWMALNPGRGTTAIDDTEIGIDYLRDRIEHFASDGDIRRALQYPSQNRWILDEFAFWLTLGHIPNITSEDFSRRDVLQGAEFSRSAAKRDEWVVCHYFSNNTESFDSWIRNS